MKREVISKLTSRSLGSIVLLEVNCEIGREFCRLEILVIVSEKTSKVFILKSPYSRGGPDSFGITLS